MTIEDKLEAAIEIAIRMHRGQRDKLGAAYILHPLRVMMSMKTSIEMQAAILHDVVEDTAVTIEQLASEGISDEAVKAIELLTRSSQDDEPIDYAKYVKRIKSNPIALRVKLADLQDNTNLCRIALREENYHEDLNRIEKYVLAYQYLTDLIDEDTYFDHMRQQK